MKIQPTTAGLSAIIAALAVALVFSHCPRPDPADKVPAPIQKTVDSLAATRPDFTGRRDSVVQVVTIDTARARKAETAAKAAETRAEGIRKDADRLAALASSQADSAALWRAAYDRRTEEAGELRTALDSSKSALVSERAARLNLGQLFAESERRRSAAEDVVVPGLERAIAKLEKPCRILGPIPCPSRRISFVAGAVGAVAIISAAK